MKKLILLFSLLFAVATQAQDSTLSNSDIITKKTFGSFKLNNHRLNAKELKAEIYKVPAAIPVFKKAKTSEIIGYSLLVPLVVSAILGNQNKYAGRDSTNKVSGFKVAVVTSGAVSIFFLFRSIKLMKKAVGIRNDQYRTVY